MYSCNNYIYLCVALANLVVPVEQHLGVNTAVYYCTLIILTVSFTVANNFRSNRIRSDKLFII